MRPLQVSSYVRSAAVVFLGAFLLFAIQPIAGKQLLPFFGGSSSVWAVSLLFFTSMLFLGYLYVYAITRFSHRMQGAVHLSLLAAATLFVLVLSIFADGLLIEPAAEAGTPALEVFLTLVLSIGIPYFLLSTTAPLIQYWYGASKGREPYSLYALSNAASLLALLSYPFVIEPLLQLRYQRGIWSALFIFYVCACAASAFSRFRARGHAEEAPANAAEPLAVSKLVLWTSFAALPSFTLVATTTQITQDIAPVPLLWIVPLALYLITFIIAFRARGSSIFTPLLFLVSACLAWLFIPAGHDKIVPQIILYLVVLFFCGLSCHVLLYKMRPSLRALPVFYLFVSLGGAVGVLAASMLAPLLFPDFWEFPIAVALSAALAAWILPTTFFPRILNERRILITKIFFILVVAYLLLQFIVGDAKMPSVETRNFYGNAEVVFGPDTILLMHGTTLHGMQPARKENARLPTTYYTPGSGIGRALMYERSVRGSEAVDVGVVGLGTGTIATYCAPGDTYVFYEIDPRIERLARSYFSYLSHCEGAEVRIGDGRLLLEAERDGNRKGDYDVLAVDAFSDDTIPTHLLTIGAFEVYASHLRAPESILAIHLSNRYLNLSPLVFRTAAEIGLNAMLVVDTGASGLGGVPSSWIVLSKDAEVFQSTIFANTYSSPPVPAARVWTDDYSSIVPALNLPKPWK